MSTPEFSPGLAGVVAVETEIAEPDREGGQLRYRGVDIEELVESEVIDSDSAEEQDLDAFIEGKRRPSHLDR